MRLTSLPPVLVQRYPTPHPGLCLAMSDCLPAHIGKSASPAQRTIAVTMLRYAPEDALQGRGLNASSGPLC